jgi:hypothetical protein
MKVPGSEDGNVTYQDASLKATRKKECGRWGSSGDDGHGRRRGVGVELDTIPLCSICCVDTTSESRDRVLEKGLEIVTIFDGGLSRDRLNMLSEEREDEIKPAPVVLTRNRRRLASNRT